MENQILDTALLLDTHEDICTKLLLQCDGCGNDLTVIAVQEQPEVAVVLKVGSCPSCQAKAHHVGYYAGQEQDNRGF